MKKYGLNVSLLLIFLLISFPGCKKFFHYNIIEDYNKFGDTYLFADKTNNISIKFSGRYAPIADDAILSSFRLEFQNNSNYEINFNLSKVEVESKYYRYKIPSKEYIEKIKPKSNKSVWCEFLAHVQLRDSNDVFKLPKDEVLEFHCNGIILNGIPLSIRAIKFVPQKNE